MKSKRIYTIAFLVTGFPPDVSGVSHFNLERAQWFANQDMYRVVVFAPDWQNESNSGLPVSDLDGKLIIERYPSKPWSPYKLTHVPKFSAASQINKKLDYYQPDLIIMTDVERFFLLSTWQLPGKDYARKHDIPYIAEYHTDLYNFSAAYPGWQWLRNTARSSNLPSYLYRQFDLTLCSSTAASRSCQEMGITNVDTIPFYSIDVSSYSPSRRHRQCLEPWLSVEEKDNKIVTFLGRIAFEKRVDLLIEAFARLKHRQPNCSLIINGDGPVDEHRLGRVHVGRLAGMVALQVGLSAHVRHRCLGARGGTSRPCTSSSTISGMPEMLVDTMGTPMAMASASTRPPSSLCPPSSHISRLPGTSAVSGPAMESVMRLSFML